MSLCIVTCGPASTPIDEVRRITNFSTGELGTLLTEALLAERHEVICLRGEGATFRPPCCKETKSFFSNSDLQVLLENLSQNESVHSVFHLAALTDFEVAEVTNQNGCLIREKKISSATPEITIRLTPAIKVIGKLRRLFPESHLIGWKYEMSGTTMEALVKGRQQIEHYQINACVVNGRPLGKEFAFMTLQNCCHFESKASLALFLAKNVK